MVSTSAIIDTRTNSTRDFFDQIAYESQWLALSEGEQVLIETAIRELAISPGFRVLEPGCGAGRITGMLERAVGKSGCVFSFDISRNIVWRAKNNNAFHRTLCAQASVLDIHLKNASVDAILCFNCFHLFACPPKALGEMARVLRPGGRLAIVGSQNLTESGKASGLSSQIDDNRMSPLVDFFRIISTFEFGYRISKAIDAEDYFLMLLQL